MSSFRKTFYINSNLENIFKEAESIAALKRTSPIEYLLDCHTRCKSDDETTSAFEQNLKSYVFHTDHEDITFKATEIFYEDKGALVFPLTEEREFVFGDAYFSKLHCYLGPQNKAILIYSEPKDHGTIHYLVANTIDDLLVNMQNLYFKDILLVPEIKKLVEVVCLKYLNRPSLVQNITTFDL